MQAKDIGGLAEVGFMYEAKKRGLHILKPMTDNRKYDFVVEGSKLQRIQVKSTNKKESKKDNFKIMAVHGSAQKELYTKEHVDFIAIFIIPADTWYIVPVEEITAYNLRINPHKESCKFDRYKEAWYQLQ